jgi:hypothetical protein
VVERDPVAEAHLIARASPGLGHPFDLTCGEFDAHLRLALNGHSSAQAENGDWMRRYVESR